MPLLPLFLLMVGPLLSGAWSRSRTPRWRWAGALVSVAAFVLLPLPRAVVAARSWSVQSPTPVSAEGVQGAVGNPGGLGSTPASPPASAREGPASDRAESSEFRRVLAGGRGRFTSREWVFAVVIVANYLNAASL